MADCCQNKACEIEALRASHARVLWIVLLINAAMFVVEGTAGLVAQSTALLADALDMFGDASVYALSLLVVARSVRSQGWVALVKGGVMLIFGLGVLAEAGYKAIYPAMPDAPTMGAIAGLALAANLVCFGLLYRHRADNLNLRSTWLCSRNDLVANVGVLLAAGGSAVFASRWPDLVMGVAIAVLFLRSAIHVMTESFHALRTPPVPTPTPRDARPISLPTFRQNS